MAPQADIRPALIRMAPATAPSGSLRFFPEVFHRSGNYHPEISLPCQERDQFLKDVIGGQYDDLTRVFAIDTSTPVILNGKVTFPCWDASEEIARAVLKKLDPAERVPDFLIDFMEQHLGCRVVAEANREAA